VSTSEPSAASAPLSQAQRARGRFLAIASHPMGMTFNYAFTGDLATLALISLGASEAVVGLYGGLTRSSSLLQLPALRAVASVPKRRILVWGHAAALVATAPLPFYGAFAEGPLGLAVVFTSLVLGAAAMVVSSSVWFPLLRGYVEPERIGGFFGILRSGWHVSLIAFFALAKMWLGEHDGAYGPLFAIAYGLGVGRIFMIVRLPERDERSGEPIRVRSAVALFLRHPDLRRYLLGVTWCGAVRTSVMPFVIVMLRRELGLSSSEIVYMTIASFVGGLVSLYVWGRAVDRFGAAPVFIVTSLGAALLYGLLPLARGDGAGLLFAMVGFSLLHSILASGFGVADTHVLFQLTPPDAPARTLVIASVLASVLGALAPVLVGAVLDAALDGASERLDVYHAFFALAAVAQAGAFWPLRHFKTGAPRDRAQTAS